MKNMILILGVTASGKGKLAFELAKSRGGEILSIDSMKVYRRMDVGTAKPSLQHREQIKYHLIDVIEPSESFSVGVFLELAEKAIKEIQQRDKPIIAVGGTALYIKALLYGLFDGPGADENIRAELAKREQEEGLESLYRQLQSVDPVSAERIDANDSKRIIRALEVYQMTGKSISSLQKQWEPENVETGAENWTIVGLRRDRADAAGRINARVGKMLDKGLVEEVKSLMAEEKPLSQQSRCAIGYAEIIDYLNGKTELADAVELIKKNTRRLAKNQRCWFKSFRDVNWLNVEAGETAEEIFGRCERLLNDL